jgi:hypothetical protein
MTTLGCVMVSNGLSVTSTGALSANGMFNAPPPASQIVASAITPSGLVPTLTVHGLGGAYAFGPVWGGFKWCPATNPPPDCTPTKWTDSQHAEVAISYAPSYTGGVPGTVRSALGVDSIVYGAPNDYQ